MLRDWGATCGSCRPAHGYARRTDLVEAARDRERALTLGWLAVTESPDGARLGTLLPLEHPVTVITRDGSVAGFPGEVTVRDDYLSAGHATITRSGAGDDARFTLADRKQPGPSSNGTFLNQRRLGPGEEVELCDGDELRVGSTELVFRNLVLPGGRP